MKECIRRKVVVTGAGMVGSTFAYALAQSGIADEIALIDNNNDLLKGQVLDLAHGLPFFPTADIHEGSYDDYKNAGVIVITAGTNQKSGESRLDLLKRNIVIIGEIVSDIAAMDSTAIIVIATNPVDLLTYAAIKKTGFPSGRVIGTGTFLDSSRLRYLLSMHCEIDVGNVHAYMLGEHGDSEFAAWSMAHIAGIHVDQYCKICNKCADWSIRRQNLAEEVRKSAYHIIDYKGSTYFAIGLALVRIVSAIMRSQNSLLTVSTLLNGEYGIKDICLSVPCIVSKNGVERIIEGGLDTGEQQLLHDSADTLRKAYTGPVHVIYKELS
jgi:L-lactate dehydrogenase